MQMYLGGQWVSAAESIPVVNPFDGREIDRVPRGTPADVRQAVDGLVDGAGRCRACRHSTAVRCCERRRNC